MEATMSARPLIVSMTLSSDEPPLIVYPTPVAGLSHLCAAFRVLIP
jgi:hypothetical protein